MTFHRGGRVFVPSPFISTSAMNIPADLKYTKEHEWIRIEGDEAVVGITDHAQSQLGDMVFVDITTVGQEVKRDAVFGTVDAVKTVSDLFMPVTCTVLEANPALATNAALVNSDPYGEGWMVKVRIRDKGELEHLLSAEQYKALVG